MTHDLQSAKMSRRRFSALALGGAGAVAAGGITFFVALDESAGERGDGAPIGAFDVRHGDDIYVTMTSGASFVVEVKERGTGAVLERHEGVTGESLATLDSEYLAIEPIG